MTVLMLLIGSTNAFAAKAVGAGAWSLNKKVYNNLSKTEKQVFRKATKKLTGVSYKPTAVIATQVVAGTNYAYLCLRKTVTSKPKYDWCVVKIYQNLKGKAKIISVRKINIKSVKTRSESIKGQSGGWTSPDGVITGTTVPADAKKAFDAAGGICEGGTMSTIALLATQTVAGKNYKYLCRGTAADGTTDTYVVVVYQDPSGKASITSCAVFDLLAYIK